MYILYHYEQIKRWKQWRKDCIWSQRFLRFQSTSSIINHSLRSSSEGDGRQCLDLLIPLNICDVGINQHLRGYLDCTMNGRLWCRNPLYPGFSVTCQSCYYSSNLSARSVTICSVFDHTEFPCWSKLGSGPKNFALIFELFQGDHNWPHYMPLLASSWIQDPKMAW